MINHEKVVDKYRQNQSLSQTARELRLSPTTIRKILNRRWIDTARPQWNLKLTPQEQKSILLREKINSKLKWVKIVLNYDLSKVKI